MRLKVLFLLTIFLGVSSALDWWQDGVIYQIYPRSFQDSDGDGIGDIPGIISRLDYLESLNVSAAWLSPVYTSPMADFGYDISNFTDIDPLYGTMEDFEQLVADAKSRGIGIVMDLVPNHSSDEHEWFIKSVAREDPYTDYYVWQPPSGYNASGYPLPPNNWLSLFGGSAWEWNEVRQQFYLHQFVPKQPDFDYRNPAIVDEFKAIIKFWLDKGVYGFRWDAIGYMFEDPLFRDEPVSGLPVPPDNYAYLEHIYTQNLPETPYTLAIFKAYMDEYNANATDGLHRIMMLEIWNNVEETMNYYRNVSDFPFNFRFITVMHARSDALVAQETILGWMNNLPEPDSWPNWVLGNHDQSRVGTRLRLTDGAIIVSLLLPGTAINYYGEELGMTDTFIPPSEQLDPLGVRDSFRTPMQWDDTINGGFTNGTPWLPLNDNRYEGVNVVAEEAAAESVLKTFRQLVALRYQPAIQTGELHTTVVGADQVLAFARVSWVPGQLSYLVVFNYNYGTSYDINLQYGAVGSFSFDITNQEMIIRTTNNDMAYGSFNISSFVVNPRTGFVATFTPVAMP